MLDKELSAIDEALLREACAQRFSESQTLDFKRELPAHDDRGKHEFLKDVCALANADGGDLVYGVEEKSGVAESIVPIASETADAAKRRLGQVLDARLEPRLSGTRFHDVPLSTGGYVLVVRVAPSFDGPHRYLFNNYSKFVMRTGTHTVELSYEQLRSAFDRTATLAEHAGAFRVRRIDAVKLGNTWRPLIKGPLCVLHVVPLAAMAGRVQVDITKLHNDWLGLIGSDWGSASRTPNLDGLIAYPAGDFGEGLPGYFQVFRTGAAELVRVGGRLIDDAKIIPSTVVTSFLRDGLAQVIGELRKLGASGPAIVGCAFLNVTGYEFGVGGPFPPRRKPVADRHHLVLPDTWIDELASVIDIDGVARPTLDVLWQAFGLERCIEYDSQGKWAPRG